MSTYLTQCQNIGRMEKHADTYLHIQTNICERRRSHFSHTHYSCDQLFESVGNRNQFDGIQDSHVQRFCATARLHAERFLNINKTRTPILQVENSSSFQVYTSRKNIQFLICLHVLKYFKKEHTPKKIK